jgi:hypothetical protein
MSEANSLLKVGTRCVIVAGCPQNIGLVVQVVQRIGERYGYLDGYEIQTVSGRLFKQLWEDDALRPGTSDFAFTERAKLRPLVDPKDDALEVAEQSGLPTQVSEDLSTDSEISVKKSLIEDMAAACATGVHV